MGRPHKTTCAWPGCDAPKRPNGGYCRAHAAEYARNAYRKKREEAHRQQNKRILITDYYGNVIQEFIAQPVQTHPMPPVEAQRKAMLAEARADGAIVAIVE